MVHDWADENLGRRVHDLAGQIVPSDLALWTGGSYGALEIGRYLVAKHELALELTSRLDGYPRYGYSAIAKAMNIVPAGTYNGYRGPVPDDHPCHFIDWSFEVELVMGQMIGDHLMARRTSWFKLKLPDIRKECAKIKAIKSVHES